MCSFLSIPLVGQRTPRHANCNTPDLREEKDLETAGRSMQPSQQLARKDAGTGGVTKQAEQAEQPQPAYILRGHASQINTLCFSKSGRWVLSGCAGLLKAWLPPAEAGVESQ